MSETHSISGLLSEKDVKRLTRLTRGGTVGPTAVYYAGVTAPIISAGMAMMTRSAFELAGLSPYWQWFLSALIAAFAGIAWYLIFIRWSYRHQHGRGTEMSMKTQVDLGEDGLKVTRGAIQTHIGWDAVEDIQFARGYTAITVSGADALIIPDKWFAKDKAARAAFRDALSSKVNA